MNECVALVPLRGGSKSIPDKNIRLIAGKPLCAWALEAACLSGVFDEVVVSTDSPKISDVVQQLQLPVRILERPPSLATDEASTESVMQHAAQHLEFDWLATIQATSPLTRADDFQRAYSLFSSGSYDSLLTAVRTKRFFWNDAAEALNYVPEQRPRRQEFRGSLMENGAFYFTKRSVLESTGCRLGGRICIYEMAAETATEIDEEADWVFVEGLLLECRKPVLLSVLAKIRLLVVDVDGTLTDGGMYWSQDGDQMKKFNTRDAKGLELVRKLGIDVAIITSENSPIVTARAKKLGVQNCFVGIGDKVECLEALVQKLNVAWNEVAYIGDDVNDLDCLKMAGFAACPLDAVHGVKESVGYIAKSKGGDGAVREICDLMCRAHAGK